MATTASPNVAIHESQFAGAILERPQPPAPVLPWPL